MSWKRCLFVLLSFFVLMQSFFVLGPQPAEAKAKPDSIYEFQNRVTIIEKDINGNVIGTYKKEGDLSGNGPWLYINKAGADGCWEGLQFGSKKDKDRIDDALRSSYKQTSARSDLESIMPQNLQLNFDDVYFGVALYGGAVKTPGAGCNSGEYNWALQDMTGVQNARINYEWENSHVIKRVDNKRTYVRKSNHPEYNKFPLRFFYTGEEFNDCQDFIDVNENLTTGDSEEIDKNSGGDKSKAYSGCKVVARREVFIGAQDKAATQPADTANPDGASTDATECESSGVLGWILCPVVTNLVEAANSIAQDFVVPLLEVRPLDTQNNQQLYDVWKSFRTIANVFFVIIFFVIIFSTAINNRQG